MKKNIKWIICFVTLISFQFVVGRAVGSAHARLSASEVMDQMQKKLNLTEAQVTTISPIIEENIEKRRELMEKIRSQRGRGDREAIRSEIQAINEDTDNKLKEILTKEQMEEWDKIKDELLKGKRSGQRRGGRRGGFE